MLCSTKRSHKRGAHSNNTSSDFALEASFSILIESRIDKDKDDFFADEVLLLTKRSHVKLSTPQLRCFQILSKGSLQLCRQDWSV